MKSKKLKENKKQSTTQLIVEKNSKFWSLRAKGKTAVLLAVILLGMVAFFLFSQQITSGNQSPAIKQLNGSISYTNGATQ